MVAAESTSLVKAHSLSFSNIATHAPTATTRPPEENTEHELREREKQEEREECLRVMSMMVFLDDTFSADALLCNLWKAYGAFHASTLQYLVWRVRVDKLQQHDVLSPSYLAQVEHSDLEAALLSPSVRPRVSLLNDAMNGLIQVIRRHPHMSVGVPKFLDAVCDNEFILVVDDRGWDADLLSSVYIRSAGEFIFDVHASLLRKQFIECVCFVTRANETGVPHDTRDVEEFWKASSDFVFDEHTSYAATPTTISYASSSVTTTSPPPSCYSTPPKKKNTNRTEQFKTDMFIEHPRALEFPSLASHVDAARLTVKKTYQACFETTYRHALRRSILSIDECTENKNDDGFKLARRMVAALINDGDRSSQSLLEDIMSAMDRLIQDTSQVLDVQRRHPSLSLSRSLYRCINDLKEHDLVVASRDISTHIASKEDLLNSFWLLHSALAHFRAMTGEVVRAVEHRRDLRVRDTLTTSQPLPFSRPSWRAEVRRAALEKVVEGFGVKEMEKSASACGVYEDDDMYDERLFSWVVSVSNRT